MSAWGCWQLTGVRGLLVGVGRCHTIVAESPALQALTLRGDAHGNDAGDCVQGLRVGG